MLRRRKLRKKKETLLQKLPTVSTAESLPHRSPRKLSNADTLLILTGVEKVSLNRGTDHEELLGEISAEDARKYMEADQFEKGSMLPKIEAGISFIEKGAHRRAIITDMAHAQDGYKEKTGTIIK